MGSAKEMLQYLSDTYGVLDILVPSMLARLTTLPQADSIHQLLSNYTEFSRTVTLLKDNSLIQRLDRFLIESIVSRLLLDPERSTYFRETNWRFFENLLEPLKPRGYVELLYLDFHRDQK